MSQILRHKAPWSLKSIKNSVKDHTMKGIDFTSELYNDLPIDPEVKESSFAKSLDLSDIDMENIPEEDIKEVPWFQHGKSKNQNAHINDSVKGVHRNHSFDGNKSSNLSRTIWKDPLENPVKTQEDLIAIAKKQIDEGNDLNTVLSSIEKKWNKKVANSIQPHLKNYYIKGGNGQVTSSMVKEAIKEAIKTKSLDRTYITSILKQAHIAPRGALERLYKELNTRFKSSKAPQFIPVKVDLNIVQSKKSFKETEHKNEEIQKQFNSAVSTILARDKYGSCEEMAVSPTHFKSVMVKCANSLKCKDNSNGWCLKAQLPVFVKATNLTVKEARKKLAGKVRAGLDTEVDLSNNTGIETDNYWMNNNLHETLDEKYMKADRDFMPHMQLHNEFRRHVRKWLNEGMNIDAIKDNMLTNFKGVEFKDSQVKDVKASISQEYGILGKLYVSRKDFNSCDELVEAYDKNPNRNTIVVQECSQCEDCKDCKSWTTASSQKMRVCLKTDLPVTAKLVVTKDLVKLAAQKLVEAGKINESQLRTIKQAKTLRQAVKELYLAKSKPIVYNEKTANKMKAFLKPGEMKLDIKEHVDTFKSFKSFGKGIK